MANDLAVVTQLEEEMQSFFRGRFNRELSDCGGKPS